MCHRMSLIKIISLFTLGIIMSCNVSPMAPELAATGDFKVAIVLPRSADDGSWSQSGYEGLQRIAKELKARVAYTDKVEVPPRKDFQQVFRQYAADGYDFIIGHGGQFQSGLEAVAKEFPQKKFALVGGYPGNNKNLGALGFRGDEMGYIMGVVVALKTQTHKVGMIGGLPVADVVDVAKLYERGAKAIDPNIQVFVNWTNSWTEILLEGATLVRQGRWQGKQYRFGMQEGVLDLAPFRGALTPEAEAIVNEIKQDILMGKIDLIE